MSSSVLCSDSCEIFSIFLDSFWITSKTEFQIHPSLSFETGVQGLGTGDTANLSNSNNNIYQVFKDNKPNKYDLISVKSIYFIYSAEFETLISNQKTTEAYKGNLRCIYKKLFAQEFRTINQLRDIVNKAPNIKYKQLAVRNWIKFLSAYDILPYTTILEWQSKIKVNERSNIDHYVPSNKEVQQFVAAVKPQDMFEYICTKIMLDSGCRVSELKMFLKTFNLKNVEVIGNVAIYSLFKVTGNKNSYYLFLTKDTYNMFVNNLTIM